MPSRPATRADVARVTETLTVAFATDPVWGVALARPDGSTAHHTPYWNLFVEGALRYSTVFVADDDSAVSLWIPPDGTELSDDQDAACRALVTASLEPGAAAAPVRALGSVRGEPPARRAARLSQPPGDAPRPPRQGGRPTAPGGGAGTLGCGRPPGLPRVDESRQRPPVRAGRVPPDRRLHGRPRRGPHLDDVAATVRADSRLGEWCAAATDGRLRSVGPSAYGGAGRRTGPWTRGSWSV